MACHFNGPAEIFCDDNVIAKDYLFGKTWQLKMWNFVVSTEFCSEAAIQRCSYKKLFWKYAANLQEKTHAKVWFQ